MAGTTPVLVHNFDLTVISNEQARAHNQAAIKLWCQDGFSGVFDPVTDSFEARLSGGQNAVVDRLGGHGDINWEVFGGDGGTVGFTAIRNGNVIEIQWNSRSVNAENFGDVEASWRFREPIMEAIRRATGLEVVGWS